MHVDPRFGVVDQDCLVHGLSNVYVAGSSVFPTGVGYANPTLTLLALAMRLADHLKASLAVLGPLKLSRLVSLFSVSKPVSTRLPD